MRHGDICRAWGVREGFLEEVVLELNLEDDEGGEEGGKKRGKEEEGWKQRQEVGKSVEEERLRKGAGQRGGSRKKEGWSARWGRGEARWTQTAGQRREGGERRKEGAGREGTPLTHAPA